MYASGEPPANVNRESVFRPRCVGWAPRLQVRRLGCVDYVDALNQQRQLQEACLLGGQMYLLLLEHPPIYTFGRKGRREHLLIPERSLAQRGVAVYHTDRGGDVTFHGPGQLVGYPIINLRELRRNPVWYVRTLEQILVETLGAFGIAGRRAVGRPGVWVRDAKIAAVGVRVSRGVTSHGFALNVDPDLTYFSNIVPCGLRDAGVTSIKRELGAAPPMTEVSDVIAGVFLKAFARCG